LTPTIVILLSGLAILLVGLGLLGTLVSVRAAAESFGRFETGLVMAGYYLGYIVGTLGLPRLVRNVGHVRTFAVLTATAAASSLGFALLVEPWFWLLLRVLNGFSVVGIYMVVESWIGEQSHAEARGRVFSIYVTSTLLALGGGQFLLLVGDVTSLVPFALATIFITLGVIPVAATRVTEPTIHPPGSFHLLHLFRVSPLGSVGALGAGVVTGAFWGMTPVFGHSIALSETDIALLMSATIFGGAILQWPIGHLSDQFDRRLILILVSLGTAVLGGSMAVLVTGDPPALVAASALYGGLIFALYGISVAHTNDHLGPGEVLEATRGLLLVYGMGAFAGPLLAGLAMERMGPAGLPLVAVAASVTVAVYGLYRMTQRSAPPLAEQADYVPLARTSPVALEMHPEAQPEVAEDEGRAQSA
jgi:MFS family permease